jgi:hypothetical protein
LRVSSVIDAYGNHDVSLPTGRDIARSAANIPAAFRVVRELTSDDLPALLAPSVAAARLPPEPLKAIKAKHHRLAQLIALGKSSYEISLITGHSPGFISGLQRDPSFAALVEHYVGVTELKFVDVLDRMRDTGMEALEQLKDRLEAEGDSSFSNRELLEVIDKLLVSPMQTQAKLASAVQGPISIPPINIVFRSGGLTPDPLNVIEGEEVK